MKRLPAGVTNHMGVFLTPAGLPGVGTVPTGSVITFSVWAKKTANFGQFRLSARVERYPYPFNQTEYVRLCHVEVTSPELSTTLTKFTFSCTTTTNVFFRAVDRLQLFVSITTVQSAAGHNLFGEVKVEGVLGGTHNSTVTLPALIPPPSIASIAPPSAPHGATVSLHGSNFGSTQGSSTVKFNGTAATPTSWGDTSITVNVPAGATSGPVVVRVHGIDSNGVQFSLPTPGQVQGTVTRASDGAPVSGALVELLQGSSVVTSTTTAANGTYVSPQVAAAIYDVRITATGFLTVLQQTLAVTAGGSTVVNAALQQTTSAVNYVYDALSRLIAVVAPSRESAIYSYDAVGNLLSIVRQPASAVSVVEFSPNLGAVGDTVRIFGTGFSPTAAQNSIHFNGVAAAVMSASATEIVTTVPVGATTGSISVTSPLGSSASATPFMVSSPSPAPPTIVAFAPTAGGAGATVVVTGTHFNAVAAYNNVRFNSVAAAATSVSSSQLSISVPIGATSGRVTVITPDGEATSAADFLVPPPPYALSDITSVGRMTSSSSGLVSITTPNTVGVLLFDGTADDWINLRTGLNSFGGCSLELRIYAPSGALIASKSCAGGFFPALESDDIEGVRLPVDGTYTLVVVPDADLVGSVSIRFVEDAVVTAVVGGPAVTLTNAAPGQNVRAIFQATAGQRISATFTNVSTEISYATLVDATGVVVSGESAYVNASFGFLDSVIPATGTYHLVWNPDLDAIGTVTLALAVVPAEVVVGATVGGAAVSATTTTPGQNAIVTFPATAGQFISLRINPFTMPVSTSYTLTGPNGNVIAADTDLASGRNFIDRFTATASGTYLLYLDPSQDRVGNATVTVYSVVDSTAGATIGGGPTVVTLNTPGQKGRLTFAAAAGQRVSLQISSVSISSSQLVIERPDSSMLFGPQSVSSSGGFFEFTPTTTGSHTVVLDPVGANSGSATFTLTLPNADINQTITKGGAPVVVNITGAGQQARLTFSGTPGQHIGIQLSSVSIPSSIVSLLGPSGSTVVSATVTTAGGFIDGFLNDTGSHTILIDPATTNTGSMTVTLVEVIADTGGPIVAGGSTVGVSITAAGQRALLTLTANAGQRVSLRMDGVSIAGGTVAIRRPDGSSLASTGFSSGGVFFIDSNVLADGGIYSVVVDPTAANTGTANLTLFDVPADATASISPAGTVTLAVGTPGQNAKLTFNGTIGQRISVRLTTVTIPGTTSVTLRAPSGSTVTTVNATASGGFIDARTLSETGTFEILLNPTGLNTGSATISLHAVPPDLAGRISVGGSGVVLGWVTPGQNGALTFDGDVGQQVTVRITGNTFGAVTVRLTAPDNATITSSTSSAAAFNLVTQFLPVTGPYRVRVDPTGANTGGLTVTVTTP